MLNIIELLGPGFTWGIVDDMDVPLLNSLIEAQVQILHEREEKAPKMPNNV